MAWSDLYNSILSQALRTLGQDVQYTPAATGVAVTIRGIFSKPNESVDVTHGMAPITGTRPTLGIRLSDLAAKPTKSDTVVVNGVTYRVIDSSEDGEGGSRLQLQK